LIAGAHIFRHGSDSHLPSAHRPRPVRPGGPDRRPARPRSRAPGPGGADRRGHEREGRGREKLCDGAPRPGAGTSRSRDGRAGCRLEGPDGVRCISMALVLEDGAPLAFRGPVAESFVWRGAMEAAALREFLGDVAWGRLDILLIDLPPGVQRYVELCDILGAAPAVLTVTIPTAESRDAVRRAMRGAVERGSPLLGIVENMVGGQFEGTAADELAAEFATRVLARIP